MALVVGVKGAGMRGKNKTFLPQMVILGAIDTFLSTCLYSKWS